MKLKINHRFSNAVKFSGEFASLRLCVEAAIKAKADLRGCDLSGSDLRGCDLSGSDLRGCDLSGCNLSGCNLLGSNLRGCNLRGSRGILIISPIGSRGDMLVAVIRDSAVWVKTGCFWGSVDIFEAKVIAIRDDLHRQHISDYMAAINLIRVWGATRGEATS